MNGNGQKYCTFTNSNMIRIATIGAVTLVGIMNGSLVGVGFAPVGVVVL